MPFVAWGCDSIWSVLAVSSMDIVRLWLFSGDLALESRYAYPQSRVYAYLARWSGVDFGICLASSPYSLFLLHPGLINVRFSYMEADLVDYVSIIISYVRPGMHDIDLWNMQSITWSGLSMQYELWHGKYLRIESRVTPGRDIRNTYMITFRLLPTLLL